MSELVANYAVVRFLPYRETGEFVNVGVVVHFPQVGYFDYRLLERRSRRVSGFFPELDRTVYKAGIDSLRQAVEQHRNTSRLYASATATERDARDGLNAFQVLTRRRESLFHFTEPKTKVVSTEPEEAVETLYADFVERAFAKRPEYQEDEMRRRVGRWLKEWHLDRLYLRDRAVGDQTYHLRLPFVRFEGDAVATAIKPLHLAKPTATEVYEHGDAWVQRMRRLRERGNAPRRMIFPIRLPPSGSARDAADEICVALRRAAAEVVPFEHVDQLRELAAA